MSQLLSGNIHSFNTTIYNSTDTDDQPNILAWLSPLDPNLGHQGIRERRVENVGEWLLQTQEFRSWHASNKEGESDSAALFCYGDQGVGKTFISSLVIDKLCDQAKNREFAVACFYFDFVAREKQSLAYVLGALLKQVVTGLEEVPVEIAQAYEDQKKVICGRKPQLADIVKMLQTTASKKRTFICIDALDECVAECRVKFLDSLEKILQNSPGTRIFVTGRPHIEAEVRKRLSTRVTTIHITPKRPDIISYLHTKLEGDTMPDAMNSSLKEDILKKIPEATSEIFLLASLNIDAILQETTIRRRRQKLNAMTDGLGLGGAYSETLSRIKGQGEEKSKLGMAALMWISHSERPLKVDELCHALGVEIGSADLDGDNVPSIGTLLGCCQGLVSVDKGASTVQLIHFTLQGYIQTHTEISGTAHSTMAETCLSYLNSRQVKALPTSPSPDLQGTPFLEYSSLYWGVHAKRELSDYAKQLALKLFDDYGNHISTKIFLSAEKSRFFHVDPDDISLFSGLHWASFFGIVGVVAGLIEVEGCDINQTDCTGSTPLLWAALNGHEEVVKILLGQGDIGLDKSNKDGRTPLWCAAENGHEKVVEILLGRDEVNPDKLDKYGRTPLRCAAENGHEGVVEMLLGRGDVSPDEPNEDGQTPLWCAALNGHDRVVKILLERDDINPNKPAEYDQSLPRHVALYGHAGVVKMPLGRNDVSLAKPGNSGETPLWCAAVKGHEGVVKILLELGDIDPDKPSEDGRTPLRCAAENGHEGVVKILLSRAVNPDRPDKCGRTPLRCAAENGHEGVVEMLLGRDDVSPDEPNEDGQTPLWCAALNGHDGVVELLLGNGVVDPDKPNEDGRTPLWCAALNGHERVVKMLLGRDDVNPDRPDIYGRTPLWYTTTRCNHAGVLALLQPPAPTTPSIA